MVTCISSMHAFSLYSNHISLVTVNQKKGFAEEQLGCDEMGFGVRLDCTLCTFPGYFTSLSFYFSMSGFPLMTVYFYDACMIITKRSEWME